MAEVVPVPLAVEPVQRVAHTRVWVGEVDRLAEALATFRVLRALRPEAAW